MPKAKCPFSQVEPAARYCLNIKLYASQFSLRDDTISQSFVCERFISDIIIAENMRGGHCCLKMHVAENILYIIVNILYICRKYTLYIPKLEMSNRVSIDK